MEKSFAAALVVLCAIASIMPSLAAAQAESGATPEVAEWSDDEKKILERGEYSAGKIVGSGLLGTIVGFGSGHAVQGRFKERGWIFAAGEGGALGAGTVLGLSLVAGGAGEAGAYIFVGGVAVAAAFRLWEIADVWTYPVVQNHRYRNLKAKSGDPKWSFYLTPNDHGGAMAGLAVRY